jgi:hypothetical protein
VCVTKAHVGGGEGALPRMMFRGVKGSIAIHLHHS